MDEKIKIYKEGDLVKICTNKCNVHLMEMFGHCEFNPNEISADEYVALIKTVINNGCCYSVTIFASYGICYQIIDKEEVLGPACIEDVPEEHREKAVWKNPIDNIMFEGELFTDNGLSPNTKRMLLAIAAVDKLHPNGILRVVQMSPNQNFLRKAIYKNVENILANCGNKSAERQKELEKAKEGMLQWFDTLQFEEHYEYHIGVDESKCEAYDEPGPLQYFMVAVNFDGNKACVMKTREDQNLFYNYLGPDFKNIFMEVNHFTEMCRKD